MFCLFKSLVGDKYEPLIVPSRFDSQKYLAIVNKAQELGLDCDLLNSWYIKNNDEYVIKDYRYLEFRFFLFLIFSMTHKLCAIFDCFSFRLK